MKKKNLKKPKNIYENCIKNVCKFMSFKRENSKFE